MSNASNPLKLFAAAASALTLGACATAHPTLETKLANSSSAALSISNAEFNREVESGKLEADAAFDTAVCVVAADPKQHDMRHFCSMVVVEMDGRLNAYLQNYGPNNLPSSPYIDFIRNNVKVANNNSEAWTNDQIILHGDNGTAEQATNGSAKATAIPVATQASTAQAPAAQAPAADAVGALLATIDPQAEAPIAQTSHHVRAITDGKKSVIKSAKAKSMAENVQLKKVVDEKLTTSLTEQKDAADKAAKIAAKKQQQVGAAKKSAATKAQSLQKNKTVKVKNSSETSPLGGLLGLAALTGLLTGGLSALNDNKLKANPVLARTGFFHSLGRHVQDNWPQILAGGVVGTATKAAAGGTIGVVAASFLPAGIAVGAGILATGALAGAASGAVRMVMAKDKKDLKGRNKPLDWSLVGKGAIYGAIGGGIGLGIGKVAEAVIQHGGLSNVWQELTHHGHAVKPVVVKTLPALPQTTEMTTNTAALPHVNASPSVSAPVEHATNVGGVDVDDAQMNNLPQNVQKLAHSAKVYDQVKALKEAAYELVKGKTSDAKILLANKMLNAGEKLASAHHLLNTKYGHMIEYTLHKDTGFANMVKSAVRRTAGTVAQTTPKLSPA